jgi:hypothetical protein
MHVLWQRRLAVVVMMVMVINGRKRRVDGVLRLFVIFLLLLFLFVDLVEFDCFLPVFLVVVMVPVAGFRVLCLALVVAGLLGNFERHGSRGS